VPANARVDDARLRAKAQRSVEIDLRAKGRIEFKLAFDQASKRLFRVATGRELLEILLTGFGGPGRARCGPGRVIGAWQVLSVNPVRSGKRPQQECPKADEQGGQPSHGYAATLCWAWPRVIPS
jgi:hypothetical protein